MVTPAARREAVAHLKQRYEMSERRACSVIGADRSSVRYRHRRPDDAALRERTDLELVVKKLLKSLCDEARQGMLDLAPEVMALLRRHHWPGNVRQLHNLLRTAVAMADDGVITPAHLPDDFLDELRERGGPATGAPPLGTAEEAVSGSPRLQDVTLDAMARMLHQHQGNVSAAARALGISRTTIYRKRHLLPPGVLG